VTQYTRQRDAELQRQANEHFAFVAHELRNPLANAQLALALLSDRSLPAPSPLAELLARNLRRMNDLIEGMLSLALSTQGIEARRARLQLRPLLADAVAESEVAARDKEIKVELDSPVDVELEGDPRLIRSALTNLINNAVKFTHRGGKVRVRASATKDAIVVDVDDACGGLPDGAIEKMFAPFVQVGEDRSGFGLGLAIARQAVQAHGGSIRARNRPGEGCTISIELPLRATTASSA
jgi:signal transduction histidine kinase